MGFTDTDAIEFYSLNADAKFMLGLISKESGYALLGNAFVELENKGFITIDEDFYKLELTEKGKRVLPLLAPEDLDTKLQNLKLHAKQLKE